MTFRVGVSDALFNEGGSTLFDPQLLRILDEAGGRIHWERLPAVERIPPEFTDAFDGLYVFLEPVTEASFSGVAARTKVIARHGVGFDSVDLAAASRRNILVTNTPLAVRKPVATMAVTFLLALALKIFDKDRLTREGRWTESGDYIGVGLTGRTVGIVGAGGIGKEIARRLLPFEMRILAADPYARADDLAVEGMILAPIEQLLAESDFVILACALTPETRHLISKPQLALMKPSAFLINIARGPVVDEAALIAALNDRRIAGAGLDVFETEPVSPDNPLLRMSNTIVTPHALSFTDESFNEIARAAITSIADVCAGREPRHVVNRLLLDART